jgi:hypothetical protein
MLMSLDLQQLWLKELEGLPAKAFDMIDGRITLKENNPRPSGVKKLI